MNNIHLVVADLNINTRHKDVKAIASVIETLLVLELKRKHQSDTLVVSQRRSPRQKILTTQWTVLSLLSAVFDLFGLVPPCTVKLRFLPKDIWRLSGQKLDDELLEDLA